DLVLRATTDIVGSRYGVSPRCPWAEPCLGSPQGRNRPRRCRQSPHVLRKGRRKVMVDVVLENKKENAYNTSLLIRFSSNLHFSSLALPVQNFGCYPVRNLTLRMALPALGYRRAAFLSVTRVLADNVSPSPEPGLLGGGSLHPPGAEPSSAPPAQATCDCGNAWCQELSCRLGRLDRGGEVSIHVLRTIHNDFFRGAKFRSVKVVSTVWLGVPGSSVLVLEEGAQRREV
ncbi:ITA10 protein, partial [Sula dactylatra]|nr:ITA10 protein [Sula dactylatra]